MPVWDTAQRPAREQFGFWRDSDLRGVRPADPEEMLDCTAAPRDERRSRLGCQLALRDGVEEVEVDVPEHQV